MPRTVNGTGQYDALGWEQDALLITRDVYSGCLKLKGEEDIDTLTEAHNYAATLGELKRFEEAKALLGKVMPVARRILGDCHELTLKMRWNYANAVREDDCATRDELREANDTLEDTARIARRVFGGAHPSTGKFESVLRDARAALRAREGDDVSAVRDAHDAMTVRK